VTQPYIALTLLAALLAGCRSRPDATMTLPADPPSAVANRDDEPPVIVNANSPVVYPERFVQEGIEGTVILRLFVDSAGVLVRDSTRVAESSGYPTLDSAALAGVPALRFAPARSRGTPIATAFLQPVHFRNPGTVLTP
jgi:TonB family protein